MLAVVNSAQSVCAIRLKPLFTEAHVLTHVLSLQEKREQLKTGTGGNMLQDSSNFYLFRQCTPHKPGVQDTMARTEMLLAIVTHKHTTASIIQVLHRTPAMAGSF